MRAAALLLAETPAGALLGVVRERRSSQTHSVVYKLTTHCRRPPKIQLVMPDGGRGERRAKRLEASWGVDSDNTKSCFVSKHQTHKKGENKTSNLHKQRPPSLCWTSCGA